MSTPHRMIYLDANGRIAHSSRAIRYLLELHPSRWRRWTWDLFTTELITTKDPITVAYGARTIPANSAVLTWSGRVSFGGPCTYRTALMLARKAVDRHIAGDRLL